MGCEGMGRAGRYVGGYAAARRSGGCAGSEWDVLWCRMMARDEGRERMRNRWGINRLGARAAGAWTMGRR